jgi:hypothetical protein
MRNPFKEPAAFVGVVEAVLAVAVVFDLFGLNAEKSSLLVGAVNAALGFGLMFFTKTPSLAAITGLAKALLAVAVGYGLSLTEAQLGAVLAGVAVLAGYFLRTQTSPSTDVSLESEPVVPVVEAVVYEPTTLFSGDDDYGYDPDGPQPVAPESVPEH